MAVIYLFDNLKRMKKPVKRVKEIVHSEGKYEARAQISGLDKPEYGDHFGFECVDGRFRLFLITYMDLDDESGMCTLTGTDAAVAELNAKIVESVSLTKKTAQEAVQETLEGTAWEMGRAESDGPAEAPDAYMESIWETLKTIAAAAKVRIVPYYEMQGDRITGRKVDILSKEPVWRGLIHTRKKGTRNIRITEEGIPYGRVFGVGKVTGTGETPEKLTFADVAWSTANGDPADKPAGQKWIALPGAKTDAEYVYESNRETDPQKLLKDAWEDLTKKQKPKASGTANIGDMEFLPGYGHRIVRMWDMAVIRTETGQTVETTVINIDRYYVQRELTKITVGEENETDIYRIERQLAKLNRLSAVTGARLGGVGNKAEMNEKLLFEASEEIKLRATRVEVEQLEQDTLTHFKEVSITLDAINTEIELKAEKVTVDNLNNVVNNLNATVTIQAGQIAQKVSRGDIASEINQTPQAVKISAGKIDLDGYVTADELKATNASISNLMSGMSTALVLKANLVSATQADVSFLSTSALNLADNTMHLKTVSMGDVFSHQMLVKATSASLSLQHSHKVSVNGEGVLQLGEVSSSGGTFNIADTQFYQDGVEAAKEGMGMAWAWPLANVLRISKREDGAKALAAAVTGKTQIEYDETTHTYKVAAVSSVTIGTDTQSNAETKEIYSEESYTGTEAYEAGYNAAIEEEGGYENGLKDGKASVTLSSAGWIDGKNVVSASNGKSKTVELPEFSVSGGTAWTSDNKTTVFFSTPSVNLPLKSLVVDASDVWDAGYDEGLQDGNDEYYDLGWDDGYDYAFDKTTVTYSNFTITNTAPNTFYAKVKIIARVNGTNAASTTITKTQVIKVGQ